MTWKQLADAIKGWTPEQQNQDVTVHLQTTDEFYGGRGGDGEVILDVTGEEPDVLDPNSYYLDIGG